MSVIGKIADGVKNAVQGGLTALGGALTLDLGKVGQGLQQAMGGGDSQPASNAASSMADDGLDQMLAMFDERKRSSACGGGAGGMMGQLSSMLGMRA